jgi:arylsulfate sulfotransferase
MSCPPTIYYSGMFSQKIFAEKFPPARLNVNTNGFETQLRFKKIQMKYLSVPTVIANSNPSAPLSGIIEFTTDIPSRAVIRVANTSRAWEFSSSDGWRRQHRIPLVGIHPGERCTVTVRSEDQAGGHLENATPLSFTGVMLPSDIPPIEVTVCVPEKREPGLILFNIRPSPAAEHLGDFGLIAAVDQVGEMVWIYRTDEAIGDVRCLKNGNILYVSDGRITEINLLGDTVREWYAVERWLGKTPPKRAIGVPTGMFHHAAIELPSGNLLACSMEIREVEEFPATEDDPEGGTETAKVVGDVLIEFDPDGRVVNEYRLLDLLDPRRVCYGSRAGYWVHRGFPATCDWSHVNGLSYDAANDQIIASVRHQDCMISINRESGDLEWILGDPGNWNEPWSNKLLKPSDGLQWQFHQHDCSVTTSGTIMCFDNGNHRALPFDKKMNEADCYSRAVEFSVDIENRSVEQIWSRGRKEDGTYSTYQSGALRLPDTGNTFINYGGVCTLDGLPSGQINKGHCQARLIEVTSGSTGEVVFELRVNDTSAEGPIALSSFRAEHYPGFVIAGN